MFDTISLEVYTTYDCNLDCPHCFQDRRLMQGEVLSEETLELAIRKCVGYNTVWVNFVGGEPLLVGVDHIKRLYDVAVRVTQEQGQTLQTQIITNGVLLDEDFITWSANANMHVVMSYDGPGKQHAKARRNLPFLGKKQQKSPVFAMIDNIHMVVHEQNVDYLKKVVDEFVKSNITKVYIAHDVYLPRDRVEYFFEKFKEMWDYINDNNYPVYVSYFMDLLCYERYKRTGQSTYRFQEEFGRYSLGREAHITPNGLVRPCLADLPTSDYKHLSEYNHIYDYFSSPEYNSYIQNWITSMQTSTGMTDIDEYISYTRGGSTFFFEKTHGGVNLVDHNISNYQMLMRLGEYMVSKPINNRYYRKLLGE